MGTIKDRNGRDLTEAEDIKKKWQEYIKKLYKKDLHDPDNHGCSLVGLMLKLKLHYFGHLMWKADSFEKTLMLAGGEGDDRGWDGWMASLTQWTWVWVNSGSWWWKGGLACCGSWARKESDTTERLKWTEPNWCSMWDLSSWIGIEYAPPAFEAQS